MTTSLNQKNNQKATRKHTFTFIQNEGINER